MFRLFLLILAGVAMSAFAGAELFTFSAYPVVDHCRLEWQTGAETNLASFVVERSGDGQVFVAVGQVNAKGAYSDYEFTDARPLLADVTRQFFYRLKMIDRDGTVSYSDIREVSLTFSAVQHTWGSVKAMFR